MAKRNKGAKSAQQSADVFKAAGMTATTQPMRGGTTGVNYGLCHVTSAVFKIPDGPVIWGGRQTGILARLQAMGPNAFDLLIGLGDPNVRIFSPEINGNAEVDKVLNYEALRALSCPPPTLVIEWADYGVPDLIGVKFWNELYAQLKAMGDGKRVAFYCDGGHGRTGTALSILLFLAALDGLEWAGPQNTVEWLRETYCEKIVESKEQVAYIGKMTGQDMAGILPADTWERYDNGKGARSHWHSPAPPLKPHMHPQPTSANAPVSYGDALSGKDRQPLLTGWSNVMGDDEDDHGFASTADAVTAAYLRGEPIGDD